MCAPARLELSVSEPLNPAARISFGQASSACPKAHLSWRSDESPSPTLRIPDAAQTMPPRARQSRKKDSRRRKNSAPYTRPNVRRQRPRESAARCSYQPVVPQTVFTPKAASRRRFSGAAAGVVNSIATAAPRSDSRESAALLARENCAQTSNPYSGASCSTRLPHFPAADNRERSAHAGGAPVARSCRTMRA